MTARSLREEVIAARTTRRMTAVALQRASGLSARTLRDIEAGSPTRRAGEEACMSERRRMKQLAGVTVPQIEEA